MTKKSEFNAEEWERVARAPALAGVLVALADRGGTFRESLAIGRAYSEARKGQGSELIEEVVGSPPHVNPAELGPRDQLRTHIPERIRQAVDVVEQRGTPEETQDYRDFILQVADVVAHAHKEGGVLGIGGKEVSEEEQAVLDELRSTIGAPAA